jgi:hypothetical protein
LTVAISKYRPPDRQELRGDVTFMLRNAGHVGFQIVHVRTQSGDTQNQDLICSIDVHPGYPEEIVASIEPPGAFNPPTLKAWFQVVTPEDRPLYAARWEVRNGQFALLRSEMTDAPDSDHHETAR